MVWYAKGTILPANYVSVVPIIIYGKLSKDRNYLFELKQVGLLLGKHRGIYTHIINYTIYYVYIFNDLLRKLEVSKNCKVRYLIDYDGEGVFYIDYVNHSLVVKLPKDSSRPD